MNRGCENLLTEPKNEYEYEDFFSDKIALIIELFMFYKFPFLTRRSAQKKRQRAKKRPSMSNKLVSILMNEIAHYVIGEMVRLLAENLF